MHPAVKMECPDSAAPKIKRRNRFRVKYHDLDALYRDVETAAVADR